MSKRIFLKQWIVVLLCIASVDARPASLPVPLTWVNKFVEQQFPQQIVANDLLVHSSKPHVSIIDSNRLTLRATLHAKQRAAANAPTNMSTETSSEWREGAVLLSTILIYDPDNKQLLLKEPRIESLLFYQDDALAKQAHDAVISTWQKAKQASMTIPMVDHPELSAMTMGLHSIDVRNDAIYLNYSFPMLM